jgi:hypothetical protein
MLCELFVAFLLSPFSTSHFFSSQLLNVLFVNPNGVTVADELLLLLVFHALQLDICITVLTSEHLKLARRKFLAH